MTINFFLNLKNAIAIINMVIFKARHNVVIKHKEVSLLKNEQWIRRSIIDVNIICYIQKNNKFIYFVYI